MKRRRTRTLLDTRIAVFLSLNIQIEQAGQAHLLTRPLLSLTALVLFLWHWYAGFSQIVTSVQRDLDKLDQSLNVWLTLVVIGWKSTLYGVGVTA